MEDKDYIDIIDEAVLQLVEKLTEEYLKRHGDDEIAQT